VRVGSERRASPDASLPFRPFSLGGGGRQYVNIWVTLQMRGCLGEQISTTVSSLPLTYRVFGVTRHTTIYLPETIQVEGGPGEKCA